MTHDILVVDDEQDIRSLIAAVLEDEGYGTRQASDGASALAKVAKRPPTLVILDIWLEGSHLDGLQVLEAIKRGNPDVPVVMISGHGTIETAVRAIKKGAYDFIEKPFKTDRLLLVVERALEAATLKREIEDLRTRSGGEAQILGNSTAAVQLRGTINRVAPTGSRVLITGPMGSGKEVVARQIHAQSRRAHGPFVVMNCAMMHPDRVETALFGTESGQSDQPRAIGLLERAHGGTLLLDEIADMPLETQGKILRVLQDQAFTRIGGTTRVEVDARVLASSNRDLTSEIEEGRLRSDLYYRLNVVPLRVPPLSERREDIDLLARHFLDQAAAVSGLPTRTLGEDAMAILRAYDWPGNVRQLKNVMEWVLIMASGDSASPVRADMLPPDIGHIAPAVLKWDKGGEIMTMPLRDARETFEREYLAAQITRFGGNVSKTAEFIGMERSALHRKLKSLGLVGNDRGERSTG